VLVQPKLNEGSTLFVWTQGELVMRLQPKLYGKKSFIMNDNNTQALLCKKAEITRAI
jgi:hypothetical protein